MKIFYDTEFIDDGSTIELISIGMVSETGEELYCINRDLSLDRLRCLPWHMENTVPSLPIGTVNDNKIDWLADHPDTNLIMPKDEIRYQVYKFILSNKPVDSMVDLWAWYGAYDHVALAQLWGPMVNLPKDVVPMYTNDLKQEMSRKEKLGNSRLRFDMPMHENLTKHNALDDARLLKKRAEWLNQI